MFSLALLLLAAVAAHASSDSIAKAERLLERLDLKNYKDFASDRESTSTDSTDSSSDANRIARAVEAALEAAELDSSSESARAPAEFTTKRLRLSTTNRANECGFFSCADVRRASAVSDIEGATATVETSDGSFTARFDAAGEATHVNDQFQFTVQYAVGADDTFTLSTVSGEFGVNVTSVTISSQATGRVPAAGLAFFRVAESSDFDDDTLLTDDESLRAALGSSVIGCDADFDGTAEALTGSATFSLATDGGRAFIVSNVTAVVDADAAEPVTITQSQTFGGNVYVIGGDQGRVADVGLLALPCASRARIVYDSTLIVTKRQGETSRTGDTLQHPLLYDALRATVASSSPDFERFIFELRVAAGRTQLRLRDVTLDTGVFSDLSHKSKFTPCFRVFPDDDYLVEAYISMRGAAGGFVRAQLQDGVNGNAVVVDGAIDDDALNAAVFDVAEGRLVDLVGDQSDTTRPVEWLPSDVSVEIEDCPEFSYFA